MKRPAAPTLMLAAIALFAFSIGSISCSTSIVLPIASPAAPTEASPAPVPSPVPSEIPSPTSSVSASAQGPIYGMTWSPDGRTIAIVPQKGILLLDAATRVPIRTIDSSERAESVAYSPDGALLACTCGEGRIRIWDAESGHLLKTLTDQEGFTSVTYSPDGQRIAAGTRGGSVKVWDASGERLILNLPGPFGDVDALTFSPDGRRLSAGSSLSGTVKVWDAASGAVIHAFPEYSGFFGIVFSPDATRMATSNIGGDSVKVWDVQTGALLATIPTEVVRFAFTPDSGVLVSAGKEGLVAWDANTGKRLETIAPYDPALYSFGFNPDAKSIIIGTRDGVIKTVAWSSPILVPPTPTLRPSILDVYPLAPGATWIYSATVETEENRTPIHWTGAITETVTGARDQGGAFIFDMERKGLPQTSAFSLPSFQYVALGNSLYQLRPPALPDPLIARQGHGFDGLQAVTWPLNVGERWGDSRDLMRGDGFLVWRVEEKADLKTPAGTFSSCYRLLFLTNPDDTTVWFCPGVGIARREYHHHGSVLNELWELQKYIPGTSLPTPTADSAITYADRLLCFQVDVPAGWTYVQGGKGGWAGFGPTDKQVINISNVSFAQTATLDLTLDNLKRGSLGPNIQSTENWVVDGQPALWVTLDPGHEFQFVVLVVPPQCNPSQHALFISDTDTDRSSFRAFLEHVKLN